MLDVTFISEFREKLSSMSLSVREYAAYFKALALADRYNYMLQLIEDRVGQHPEVMRVPELKTILLNHLTENYANHIDLRLERLFNPTIVGTDSTLRLWQEAGYKPKAKRTTRNYFSRVQYWKSIYNNEPIRVTVDGTAKSHKKSTTLHPRTGDDIFGDVQQRLFYEVRVKDRSGNIVTYEDVIKKRNLGFGAAANKLIPFWITLNYGTDVGMQPGYPSVAGLHFIEDAERTVSQALTEMSNQFPRFLLYLLDTDVSSRDFTLVQNWTSTNLRLVDGLLDPHAIAIELAYGLPF